MKIKKLNNRGISLTELLISVALISVVMLFLYRLLADINFQKDNDYFAMQNQQQRIEIIDTIHQALKDLGEISKYNNLSNSMNFTGNHGTVTIRVSSTNIRVQFKNGGISEWDIKKAEFVPKIICTDVDGSLYDGTNVSLVECKIRVETDNIKNKNNNNNTIDDIEFSFTKY